MILRRKICAALERLTVGSEKPGQWPPPLASERAHGDLVTAVDVGTFIAIDLHGNKIFVDDLRDFGIVVRFTIHHMAPMAPDRADVEQHRLILAARGGEGVVSPLV